MAKEEVNIRSLIHSMASAWDCRSLTVIRLGANPFDFFLSSEDEAIRVGFFTKELGVMKRIF